MVDVNTVMWWYSRAYLYIFVSLFIYVILSVFISVIMDTYENIKVCLTKYCCILVKLPRLILIMTQKKKDFTLTSFIDEIKLL